MHLDQPSNMAPYAEPSSIFGIDYDEVNNDPGYGGFAAFEGYRSPTPSSTTELSFTSTPLNIEDSIMANDTATSRTQCGYSAAYGLPISACDAVPTATFDPLGSEVIGGWESLGMSNINAGMVEFGLPYTHDGLPIFSEQDFATRNDVPEDQTELRWNTCSPLTWSSDECGQSISTMSKTLDLKGPSTFVTSTNSSKTALGTADASNDSEATSSIHDAETVLKAEKSTLSLRHALPSSPISTGTGRLAVPAIARNDAIDNNSKTSGPSTADSTAKGFRNRGARTVSATTGTRHHAVKPETNTGKQTSLLETNSDSFNTFRADIQVPFEAPTRRDATSVEKDQYLVEARKAGLSYKVIRAQGNFSEAESTLRGRYRSLTKAKKDRVRKPQWTKKDVGIFALIPDDAADYAYRIDY